MEKMKPHKHKADKKGYCVHCGCDMSREKNDEAEGADKKDAKKEDRLKTDKKEVDKKEK